MPQPLVAVIMGSKSDWETMRHCDETLTQFGVAHECRVLSAHRTPQLTSQYASEAESRGFEVIVAAAGGAAHLAGVLAAQTVLPVLGVPMETPALKGLDSLLSTVQMPGGIPVGTLAGVLAAQTVLPVLGVPMETPALKGLDSLLSTVQMPGGIPVGTLAIGSAGARNAALLAIAILANSRPELREKLKRFRAEQTDKVARETLP